MTQILLLEDDVYLSTILRLNLTKTLGGDVLLKNTSVEAIALLELLGDLNMIITKDVINNEPVGLNLQKYLKDNNLKTTLLVFGKNLALFENKVEINSTQEWKKLLFQRDLFLGKV